jgi:hypothetical protein
MTQEVKHYIENHKEQIENNSLTLFYFDCPLNMLKELVEVLSIAGITYPPQLHNYVTVCCYVTDLFLNQVNLEQINYGIDYDEFVFTTNSLKRIHYNVVRAELFDLIPSCIDCAFQTDWAGYKTIKIKIRNN